MMRAISTITTLTATLLALTAPLMAEDTLYLNCKCTAVFNSSFPDRSPNCPLYAIPDITVIVDTATRTVDLKSPDHPSMVNGLSGPAAISPGTISGHWNGSQASQAVRAIDLNIDRTSGEYTLRWDFGETKIRWSGMCKKGDALPAQF